MAKRLYSFQDKFCELGFTCLPDKSGADRPQCLVCLEVLAHTSLVDSKLRRHLVSKHPNLVGKPPQFWKDKEAVVKRRRIDTETPGFSSMRSATEASFRVAYLIAQCKKPHTIGEELIKPAALLMTELMCGKDAKQKMESVPLSNNTVRRRINLISSDILD